MSLRINTNLPAMTALRNLGNTQSQMAQSINRLSTGLRINSAADDPAGLIISEGMRGQLTGISQAIMNSQDAINMSKTADGAMNEAQSLLNSIRGIAVGAANSAVVDSAQLQADQTQIRTVIQSIDRIAGSTTWGTKQLLNGTAGVNAQITDGADFSGANFGSTLGGLQIANGPITVTRTASAAQTSLTTDKTFAAGNTVTPAGNIVVNGYTFNSDGVSDTVQGMVDKINGQSSNTGVTASLVPVGGNVSVKLTSTQYGSKYPVNYFDTSAVLNTTVNPAPTVAGADATASVTASTLTPTGAPTTTTVTFTGGQGPQDSGLLLTDGQGNSITLTPPGNVNAGLGAATAVGVINAGSVRFQLGPNSSQSVSFSMPDSRASQLGTGVIAGQNLSTIDVTTQAGATQAIDIIDKAIQQLASSRASLGAFQSDYLESNLRSLNVANENLTAAESTIRDTDIASEMSQYTKTQILNQAGVAVLAQANQAPQQVLKLLQ